MLWNKETPLYMAVKEPNGYHGEIKTTMWSVWPTWESWNWNGSRDPKGATVHSWEGKPIEVEVYTKEPEVKLYLNDQLIGTKKVNRETEFKAVFTVNYEPGTLRAEANGQSVAKTPEGMFEGLEIPNDLKFVDSSIREYYGMDKNDLKEVKK